MVINTTVTILAYNAQEQELLQELFNFLHPKHNVTKPAAIRLSGEEYQKVRHLITQYEYAKNSSTVAHT